MARLQDDWKELRVTDSTPPLRSAVQEPLSDDWADVRYGSLPPLPRYAYRVVGENFETAALQRIELLGRLDEPGRRQRSRLGYARYRVVDTLWAGPRDSRRDIGQTIRGSLDHIDLTLEDALARFRSDVETWRGVTEMWRRRALEDIEERKSRGARYEAELNAMKELDGISEGILRVIRDAKPSESAG